VNWILRAMGWIIGPTLLLTLIVMLWVIGGWMMTQLGSAEVRDHPVLLLAPALLVLAIFGDRTR
jgi:hypothetical protein